MEAQQVEGMGFVRAHLAAKADDVGEHDRGQPPSLTCTELLVSAFIGQDYSAGVTTLSTCWLTLYGLSKFLGKCRAALQPITTCHLTS
jgi:hypothetical protein